MPTPLSQATVGVRLLALLIIVWGLLSCLKNGIEFADEFNPSYLGFFFYHYLLFPLSCIALGFVLWKKAKCLASKMTRDL